MNKTCSLNCTAQQLPKEGHVSISSIKSCTCATCLVMLWRDEILQRSAVFLPNMQYPPLSKLLCFEWSPPWHLFVIVSDTSSEYMVYSSDIRFWHSIWQSIYLTLYFGVLSGSNLSSTYSDILFWHSIWYIIGDSLWLRSGGKHSDPELAVEVRQGTLWSWACGGGPARNALFLSLLFGSGGEHCDLALAVEVRRRRRMRRKGRRRRWRDSWHKI